MAGRTLAELGYCLPAKVGRFPATRPESATGRRVHRARNVALEHDAPPAPFAIGVRQGNGREQRLRIGMGGALVDPVRGADLDDAAEIHDRHATRDMTHDCEIVRDEEVGDAERPLQFLKKVDDSGLNGDVERGYRLVEHQRRWA